MKKKQMCYQDEIKPSFFSLYDSYYEDYYDDNYQPQTAKQIRINHKSAIATREAALKYGKKYKGKIIKTEISAFTIPLESRTPYSRTSYSRASYSRASQSNVIIRILNALIGIGHAPTYRIGNHNTVYVYHAVIEYINDKGEKVTFTTPRLNGNPEYLDSKEVSVYAFDGVSYATDFGYIIKPKRDYGSMFKMN